jgi:hypothetical protein
MRMSRTITRGRTFLRVLLLELVEYLRHVPVGQVHPRSPGRAAPSESAAAPHLLRLRLRLRSPSFNLRWIVVRLTPNQSAIWEIA